MLTGQRAFKARTISDVLAAVLDRTWTGRRLPARRRRACARCFARCLKRDPRQRLRDIGEARVEIDETIAEHGETIRWRRAADGWHG